MSDWRSGTIYFAQMYSPANSDSAAEDITHLMICAMMRAGLMYLWTGTSSDSIMWVPALLLALLTFRQAASEWADSTMLLAEDVPVPKYNGPVLTIAQIIKCVMSSAAEA